MAALIVPHDGHLRAPGDRPATTSGKNCMPRIAAMLDVPQISEIIATKSLDTFERLIYAGNAIQTVQSTDAKKVITVRTAAYQSCRRWRLRRRLSDRALANPGLSEYVGDELSKSDRPELTSAKVDHLRRPRHAVRRQLPHARKDRRQAGRRRRRQPGRGRCRFCAQRLPGRPDRQGGCPRPLHRGRHFRRHPAPRRHEGQSKVIVAINKDEEAPIFQVADFGLVADLFKAVPELEAELEKAGY